jgi:hypothetical protein
MSDGDILDIRNSIGYKLIWKRKAWNNHQKDDVRHMSYLDVMRDWTENKCQDPRDKIYGLFGLFPQTLRDSPRMLSADYGKSVEEVFEDVVVFAKENLNWSIRKFDYSAEEYTVRLMFLIGKRLGLDVDRRRKRVIQDFFQLPESGPYHFR